MKRKFLSFLAAGMLFTLPAAAQSVGVVMSGGGAKGLYHIGVLQALEESGIPIDYVSGTSMGSIIAGMYAAGYSPEEMRRIVASGVVKQWVSGRIDPSYLPYYRRNTGTPIFLSIRLNMKDHPDDPNASRFRLPSYLISSNQIDLALADLFGPATTASRRDFDSLMVPFLCVASDMNTRRPVVLRKGDMGEAIRSSMSIPLAFKPMKIDTMLLYDGGIYDNFPWEPLDKEFHPDFLIGSKCTSGNNDITENSSLVDQAFSLAMNKTNYDMPEGRSLMINRAVNVSMLDFNSADSIIEAGYRDALAQIPALREKIHRIVTPEEIRTKRAAFREKCPPIIFDDYEFEGLTHAQTAYVRDVMRLDDTYDGRQRQMSFPEFRDDFFSVIGNDEFSVEYPKFRYDPLRERYSVKLKMSARENLRFLIGGNISSTAFNQAFIGFDYHTIRRVSQWAFAGIYIGPTYATGSLGGRTDFYLWKPFSLDYSYNFEVLNLRHGNFGNLTAGLFARRMGLPVDRFIAANNANDTFYEYLRTGSYRPRPSVPTLANAMDVGDPNNFARILDLYGRSLDALRADVAAFRCDDDQIRATVADTFARTGYLLDPHGACGYRALRDGLRDGETGIFLETAHPAKFVDTVESIIGRPVEIPQRLQEFVKGKKRTVALGAEFEAFKEYLLSR